MQKEEVREISFVSYLTEFPLVYQQIIHFHALIFLDTKNELKECVTILKQLNGNSRTNVRMENILE